MWSPSGDGRWTNPLLTVHVSSGSFKTCHITVMPSLNFLHLNPDKTEILLIGPDNFASTAHQFISPFHPNVKPTAENLGIIFDQCMTLDQQVTKLAQSCFLQLRIFAKIRCTLSSTDLELLIPTFIFPHLDYWNSLYTCLRLLTTTTRWSHITPVLQNSE